MSTATINKGKLVGYDEPIIIDCDLAKRPQDTDRLRYSELSGPASRVPWDQACQIIGKIGDLAQGLSPIQAGRLKETTAIVEGEGHPPRLEIAIYRHPAPARTPTRFPNPATCGNLFD